MNPAVLAMHQRSYERALHRWLEQVAGIYLRALEAYFRASEARADAVDAQLGLDFGSILQLLNSMTPTLIEPQKARTLVYSLGWNAAQAHKQTLSGQLAKKLKPANRKKLERIDLWAIEPWLKPALEKWTAENVSLITAMPQQMLDQVRALVMGAVPGGLRHETLAKKLKSALDVPDWRARLIARDQTAKWNSKLTRERYQRAGITIARWRTARDRRVVGTPGGTYPVATDPSKHGNHYEREGLRFLVGVVPLVEVLPNGTHQKHEGWNDGEPGHGIQCRCWWEPEIEGLEDLMDDTNFPVTMGGG